MRNGLLPRSTARASLPLATAAVAVLALGLKLIALFQLPPVIDLDSLAMFHAPSIDEAVLLAAEPAAGPAEQPPAATDEPVVPVADRTTAAPPSCPTSIAGLEDVAEDLMQRRDRLGTLTRVASRIREAKMAAILAAMDPEKARRVTIELARRLSPRPEANSG
jgi:hypothetical protein